MSYRIAVTRVIPHPGLPIVREAASELRLNEEDGARPSEGTGR